MPFDAVTTGKEAGGKLAFEQFQQRPTLEGLAYALRHRETWPAWFQWSYMNTDSCALGLAVELSGDIKPRSITNRHWVMMRLGLSDETSRKLFLRNHAFSVWHPHWWFADVTPEMVANVIDRYLRTGK
jgi:hypothetical protein